MPIEYDLAISFAGEDRAVAQRLANELNTRYGLVTFYDEYEQAKLWGENLTEYFIDVYRNKARYCVVLVSKHYVEKRWTKHEWRAAQARAWESPDRPYILPLRLDDSKLPGLLPTVGYVNLTDTNFVQVTRLIFEKVGDLSKQKNRFNLASQLYSEGKYDDSLAIVIDSAFDLHVDALRLRADIYGKKARYPDAREALHTILSQRPTDFLANFLLGIFYYRSGDYENSVKYFEVADTLSPGHPTIETDLPAAKRKLAEERARRET